MQDNELSALMAVFIPLSLVSIGGGASIISGMEREVVDIYGWATSSEFIEMYAVSRVAPGPGTMLATLVGWKVMGWTGAIVASLAIYLPTSLLCYGFIRTTGAFRERTWYRVLRDGLAPVGTGLVIAGVMSIIRMSGGGIPMLILTFGAALVIAVKPKISAMYLLLLGGVALALLSLLQA